MGGECNYLLRVNRERRLEFVPDAEWKSQLMLRWSEAEVQAALDEASAALAATAKHLRLPVHVRRPDVQACHIMNIALDAGGTDSLMFGITHLVPRPTAAFGFRSSGQGVNRSSCARPTGGPEGACCGRRATDLDHLRGPGGAGYRRAGACHPAVHGV